MTDLSSHEAARAVREPHTAPFANSGEEQTAAASASASPGAFRPRTLLTPAVTRVIAWHQQRLSARHGGGSSHP